MPDIGFIIGFGSVIVGGLFLFAIFKIRSMSSADRAQIGIRLPEDER